MTTSTRAGSKSWMTLFPALSSSWPATRHTTPRIWAHRGHGGSRTTTGLPARSVVLRSSCTRCIASALRHMSERVRACGSVLPYEVCVALATISFPAPPTHPPTTRPPTQLPNPHNSSGYRLQRFSCGWRRRGMRRWRRSKRRSAADERRRSERRDRSAL